MSQDTTVRILLILNSLLLGGILFSFRWWFNLVNKHLEESVDFSLEFNGLKGSFQSVLKDIDRISEDVKSSKLEISGIKSELIEIKGIVKDYIKNIK